MSKRRLEYETPQSPATDPIGWVPWVGIGVCLALILGGIVLLVRGL